MIIIKNKNNNDNINVKQMLTITEQRIKNHHVLRHTTCLCTGLLESRNLFSPVINTFLSPLKIIDMRIFLIFFSLSIATIPNAVA